MVTYIYSFFGLEMGFPLPAKLYLPKITEGDLQYNYGLWGERDPSAPSLCMNLCVQCDYRKDNLFASNYICLENVFKLAVQKVTVPIRSNLHHHC